MNKNFYIEKGVVMSSEKKRIRIHAITQDSPSKQLEADVSYEEGDTAFQLGDKAAAKLGLKMEDFQVMVYKKTTEMELNLLKSVEYIVNERGGELEGAVKEGDGTFRRFKYVVTKVDIE